MPSLNWIILFLSLCLLSEALSFDYIIVGAGPSGLTLANRLSANPQIRVAVVEAGSDVRNNPNVTDVTKFTIALGTEIDWQYKSVAQTFAGHRVINYPSGKALGGTSTINGMTYIRAQKAQIDSWEALGNSGWNWDSLLPYYKKSEHFDVPTAAQVASGASFDQVYHGETGPLNVGFPYGLLNGTFTKDVQDSWEALGVPVNKELNGGDVRGISVAQSTLDRDANVREDAARAYYYPIEDRSNLRLFLNTTANRIVWESRNETVAKGIEVTHADGAIRVLNARKEVIISAGSLRSPAILELSGIGNPNVLSRFDIPVKVDLPGVGENLQDQPNNNFILQSNATFNGTMSYAAFGNISDILGQLPPVNISEFALKASSAINNSISATSLTYLLQLQYDLLASGVPDAESIIGTTLNLGLGPSSIVASAFWLLMPFSRGHVHISSSDPLVYPNIDPNYFLIDFDLNIQVAVAKWTRKFWQTEPVSHLVTEVTPGFEALPLNATDETWGEWVKSTFSTNSHPLGTAAMISRELGGVVDSRLKVYGTKNVRVVDASIMPLQVSGHLTSTLYAIAEKAADLIIEDHADIGL